MRIVRRVLRGALTGGSITRTGLQRGLLEGSNPWLAVGVVAGGARLLRRIHQRRAEVVYRAKLDPGESLVITHVADA